MVGLYRRGRTWWTVYRVRGKLVRESLKTRSHPDALSKAKRIQAKLDLGQIHADGRTQLADAIDTFIEHQQKLRRDKTVAVQRQQLDAFAAAAPKRIGKVEPPHVSAFLDGLSVKPATRNRYRAAIHRFFEWARREARLYDGPNPAADVVRAREVRLPPEYVTREERDLVLPQLAGTELEVPFALGVLAGLRMEESISLDWAEVDLAHRTISAKRTKSDRYRTIPMHPRLYAILKAREPKKGLVCVRTDGGAWTKAALYSQLLRLSRRLGMPKLRLAHALRHGFGTACAAAGVPAPQIKEWMGHSSLATTQRYMHVAPGARGRIDEI